MTTRGHYLGESHGEGIAVMLRHGPLRRGDPGEGLGSLLPGEGMPVVRDRAHTHEIFLLCPGDAVRGGRIVSRLIPRRSVAYVPESQEVSNLVIVSPEFDGRMGNQWLREDVVLAVKSAV